MYNNDNNNDNNVIFLHWTKSYTIKKTFYVRISEMCYY